MPWPWGKSDRSPFHAVYRVVREDDGAIFDLYRAIDLKNWHRITVWARKSDLEPPKWEARDDGTE